MPKSRTGKQKTPQISYIDLMSGAELPEKMFYLVTGSDLFAFSQIEKTLKDMFLMDDPSELNFARFDCDHKTKGSAVVSLCEEYPFGSLHKLVVLHNAHRLNSAEGDKIKKYLENPMPTTVLVLFENVDEAKTSGAGKFTPSRSLKTALKNFGLQIQCKLYANQIKDWVRDRFSHEGKKIDRSALEHFLSMVGEEMWDLHQEIEKIVLYTGKRDTIHEEDVEAVVSHRPQSKIFNLTEQLGRKSAGGSLKILDELLKEKTAGVLILSAVNNHFELLYRINRLMDRGESQDSIAKSLRKHPFYVKKCMGQARNFSEKSFETIFDLLARSDGGLKSGLNERRVLELTFIQISRMRA